MAEMRTRTDQVQTVKSPSCNRLTDQVQYKPDPDSLWLPFLLKYAGTDPSGMGSFASRQVCTEPLRWKDAMQVMRIELAANPEWEHYYLEPYPRPKMAIRMSDSPLPALR